MVDPLSQDDHLWVDEEGYPADHNKEPAWEVVGDDVERHFPGQHELVISFDYWRHVHHDLSTSLG